MRNITKILVLTGSLLAILASCVKEDPVTVEFKSAEYQLAVGYTMNLAGEVVVGNSAEKPVYTVSDDAVVSVSAEGLLSALATGEATVTAGVEGITASCRVVVLAGIKADSLVLHAPQKLMAGGAEGVVKAEVYPEDYDVKNLEWSFTATPETFAFQKDTVSASEYRLKFPTFVEGGKVTVKVTDVISGLSRTADVVVTDKPIAAEKVTVTCVESLTAMEGLWTSVKAEVSPTGYDAKHLVWEFKPSSAALNVRTEQVSGLEYRLSFLNYVENGSVVITVTDTISQNFSRASVKVLELPENGVNSISISPETLKLYTGDEPVTLAVTHDPAFYDPALLKWETSDEKVVTVEDGVVTVVGLGEAQVTVTDIISKKSAECLVTVSEPVKDVVIKRIDLNRTNLSLKVGQETVQLIATCYDEGGKVVENYSDLVWSAPVEVVRDGELEREVVVVEVSQSGVVTPKNYGNTTITVSDKKNGAVEAVCSVHVDPADVVASKVTVTPAVQNIRKGETCVVTVVTEPAGVPVRFSSSDDQIATVDGNGRVTGVGNGTAVITVTADGGKTATCEVIVADKWVELSESEITLVKGNAKTLVATIRPDDQAGKTVVWKSSDEAVAAVDQTGKVTAKAKGTAVITASAEDCVSAECKVVVEDEAVEFDITISPDDVELPQEKTVSLMATYARLDGSSYAPAEKSWWSSDETVATVDNKGNVTAVYEEILGESDEKSVKIYHSADSRQAYVTVKVVRALPEQVRFTALPVNNTMMHGDVFQLKAEVLPAKASQEIIWVMDAFEGSNATVDHYTGLLEARHPGKAIVWAHASGTHLSVRASVEINILPIPVESFTITGDSNLEIKVGDALYLETQILPADASYQTITWKVSQEGTVSVGEDGKLTALAAGEVVVTGTLPDGKSVSYSIKVSEASSLNVGDYYYSDGTTSSELDPDKTVVGIVFSTQNPRLQDAALGSSCVNGLAVSLVEIATLWQESATNVGKWLQDNGGYSNLTNRTVACGYSNTVALTRYNESNPDAKALVAGQEPEAVLPDGASSWYVPSYADLEMLKRNLAAVNAGLLAAGGTKVDDKWAGEWAEDGYYWSSTENENSSSDALAVHMSQNASGATNKNKTMKTYKVRYIFAF